MWMHPFALNCSAGYRVNNTSAIKLSREMKEQLRLLGSKVKIFLHLKYDSRFFFNNSSRSGFALYQHILHQHTGRNYF